MTLDDEKVSEENILFTCLSCSIAFPAADAQREHYRSDHHKYNMKRRIAALPPVSAEIFNQKVSDRRQEVPDIPSAAGSICKVCNKTYATENAYRTHLKSKRHREKDVQVEEGHIENRETFRLPRIDTDNSPTIATSNPLLNDDTVGDMADDIQKMIDKKIAAARPLSVEHCLFCPACSSSLEENLSHMTIAHSFFVPDSEYLVNMAGLITYLGEKVAVGNVCIYCNLKSREFRSIEAVRKHMVDKSHCKIAYDSAKDRLEVSGFYDFSPSYPDFEERKGRKRKEKRKDIIETRPDRNDDEWEDIEGDVNAEVDEIVDAEEEEGSDDDSVPDNQLTYGDTMYELVLPSGARIGHREMRRYYAQSYSRISLAALKDKDDDPKSGAALVRRLLRDKKSMLVPRKGGLGAFGIGTEVVKARNRGEAREAGRHVREFRDQKRREEFKTRVAFNHNYQKHFRDPLLQ